MNNEVRAAAARTTGRDITPLPVRCIGARTNGVVHMTTGLSDLFTTILAIVIGYLVSVFVLGTPVFTGL